MKKTKTKQSLEDTLKEIRDKFGQESIILLNEKPDVGIESIPTGSLGVDNILGVGGFPRGRIVEIYGLESSGKTTLALHAVAEAQKMGKVCAYIDAEHALDPQYAERIGVKTDQLLISQPDTGEEALKIVSSLVNAESVGLIVVDSVAALTPKDELDGEIGDKGMALQARMMSQAMRMLTSRVAKSNTLVIFINQIRSNIGGYGNPEVTAGGRALKFYSSVRVELKKIATIKRGEDAVGSRVRIRCTKNKVAPPFKTTEADILYNEGLSPFGEAIILGEKYKIIAKNGAMYRYGEETLGRGYEATLNKLREDKTLFNRLVKDIRAAWQ